jgi:hypothetical protein
MDEHEASLLAHQGGITAGAIAPDLKLAVEKNTKLLSSFGAESIPYIVTVGLDGKVIGTPGSLSTADLAKLLGVQVGAEGPTPASAPVIAAPSL